MEQTSYKVNLPKTNFAMKANLTLLEPKLLEYWENNDIYSKAIKSRNPDKKFILHDGPPYLSSNKIHIGTALNKILKDIITKYKTIKGYYSPYVPGYDSHGLPIENAVLKSVKGGRSSLTAVELRNRCEAFALENLKGQEAEFKRLGVWGDFANPYITLDKKYEASQIRVFAKMFEKGYLYKGLKAVSWCPTCETALADAEIEYQDHTSNSVYVAFEITPDTCAKLNIDKELNANLVIWTTTPWTLLSNLAIAVNKDFEYELLKTPNNKAYIVASLLKDDFIKSCNFEKLETLKTFKGSELTALKYKHNLEDRTSPVILSNHVTSESGSGLVHIAPGHGPEDFELGMINKLGIISPVNERGVFTDEVKHVVNLHYTKANDVLIEILTNSGHLLSHNKFSHSYPHCWRCKKALIFRATKQWFASVDGFREEALKAVDNVNWIPESGRNRIYSMLQNRFDWCISRQRSWGVPIPAFYCQSCNELIMTPQIIENVAKIFESEGSNSFWIHDAKYFLGSEYRCPKCNHDSFNKETDIMDVWFDSGVSHEAVINSRPELMGSPCELYLEGSDQHRGWFQSSLLTSVAITGKAPYKTVLTHGFVMDEHGKKMSKSIGNVVEPEQVIKQYGADILRLWVASVNYSDDIPIGKNMLVQLADIYRKIRNTIRYMLGNLYDFDPKQDYMKLENLNKLDAYMLHRLNILTKDVEKHFDNFEFHRFYQLLQNFCVVELSSFYFDIAKDILYTKGAKSHDRLSVQTVLYELVISLCKIIAPVMPFLAEDAWQHLPETFSKDFDGSILLTDFPEFNQSFNNEKLADEFEKLIILKNVVNKALEIARSENLIGSSLEAKVAIKVDDNDLYNCAKDNIEWLANLLIISQIEILTKEDSVKDNNLILSQSQENLVNAFVYKASGEKCLRCWKYSFEAQSNHEHKNHQLCNECIENGL